MSTEKDLFIYGFLTVLATAGIIYLLTGDFIMTTNAGCAGSIMATIGMIALRYETAEIINKNTLLNLFVYLMFGICIGVIIGAIVSPASALSVDTIQDGKFTRLNITGEPPFDIYSDDGNNWYTWSNVVVMELPAGRTNQLVIIDGLNDTVTATVDVPIVSVDIFISIIVIVSALLALLGIRYPLFIIPSMALSLIWFGYMAKNLYINELQAILYSVVATTPFLAMAYWGLNK